MLSASSAHRALRVPRTDDDAADAVPRYSEAAGVEHHPQVTGFVPRKFRSIALLAIAGAISTAAVIALHWFVAPLAAGYGVQRPSPLELGTPGNLAAWTSAVLLLAAAADCLLIYSLRRHRIDDYRGRYRAWLAAAFVCLLLSLNSVAPLHGLMAAVAAHHVGWTALADHAIWWLVVGGLPLGWIALRSWLDACESRLAAAALAAAFLAYAAGLVSLLAGWPAMEPPWLVIFTAAAPLIGHWMLIIGLVSYSRFVVLDAQGLVPVRRSRRRQQAAETLEETKDMGQRPIKSGRSLIGQQSDDVEDSNTNSTYQTRGRDSRSSGDSLDRSRWTDGSEPDGDDYDDDGGGPRNRKLTKAERKRMRKLKDRNRAA
jgi:hypothetical protein